MTPTIDPVVWHAVAAALSLVFLLAGLTKLRSPGDFVGAVEAYAVLPAVVVPAVARAFMLLEVAGGLLLLWPETRAAGAGLAAGILFMALVAGALHLSRGNTGIDCGCSLGEPIPLGPAVLWRAASLLGAALMLLLPVQARQTVWLDVLAGLLLAVFLFGLQVLATTLIAHGARLNTLKDHP